MRRFMLLGALSLAMSTTALAQTSAYRQPPAPIAQILDSKPTPVPLIDPTRSRMALLDRANLPSIAELAEPDLKLAGYRINPRNNGQANSRVQWLTGLSLQNVAGGAARTVQLAARHPLHRAFLVSERPAPRLPRRQARRARAVGRRRRHRQGAPADPADRQCRRDRRSLRLDARQPLAPGPCSPGRTRAGSVGAGHSGPDRPGQRRPHRARPHLSGPPQEPRRRAAVRPLFHRPADCSSRSPTAPAARSPRPASTSASRPRPTADMC